MTPQEEFEKWYAAQDLGCGLPAKAIWEAAWAAATERAAKVAEEWGEIPGTAGLGKAQRDMAKLIASFIRSRRDGG